MCPWKISGWQESGLLLQLLHSTSFVWRAPTLNFLSGLLLRLKVKVPLHIDCEILIRFPLSISTPQKPQNNTPAALLLCNPCGCICTEFANRRKFFRTSPHFSLEINAHTKYESSLHDSVATEERAGVSFMWFTDVSAITLPNNDSNVGRSWIYK